MCTTHKLDFLFNHVHQAVQAHPGSIPPVHGAAETLLPCHWISPQSSNLSTPHCTDTPLLTGFPTPTPPCTASLQCGCKCTKCCYASDPTNCTSISMGTCPYDCLERSKTECGIQYSNARQSFFCAIPHPSSWPAVLQVRHWGCFVVFL